MKKWVSVEEAAALTQRSHHTIYNWVYKSRQKESSGPLTLKSASSASARQRKI